MFIDSVSMWLIIGTIIGFILGILLMKFKVRKIQRLYDEIKDVALSASSSQNKSGEGK